MTVPGRPQSANIALAAAGVALFCAAGASSLVSSCGGIAKDTTGFETAPDPAGDAHAAAVDGSGPDARDAAFDDAGSTRPPDAQPPAPPDAGAPPAQACSDDASPCATPESRCVDSCWIVSYANGRCLSGTCDWEKTLYDCCQLSSGCRAGLDGGASCGQVIVK